MNSSLITADPPERAFAVPKINSAWRTRTAAWLAVPPNAVAALITVSLLLRVIFANWYGLGIDESYMVAAGRQLQLSYYDHPPLAWWLAWAGGHLFGNESGIAVRTPFIILFAISTWLIYRLGALLFSPQAGLWAAVLLNLVPVLGFTAASWVVPDGPLDCALLGFALSLTYALEAPDHRRAAFWWLAVGACAGLAMLAKYSAVLTLAGAGIYLLTQPRHRLQLARPWPWLSVVVAFLIFSPVVIWNAEHGWASFVFQTGRAAGHHFHIFRPFSTLAGEALFLMPWIWLPLVWSVGRAASQGSSHWRQWLLCCLGVPPVLVFTLISAWSHERVLYHWAAPGYMMGLPLLGAACAEALARGSRPVRLALAGSAIFLVLGVAVVGSEVRWNWMPEWGEDYAPGRDPDLAAVNWNSLLPQFQALGLLKPGGPVFAATRWVDAGKLDYSLGGKVPVICLGDDPREYGFAHPMALYAGRDVVIVAPNDQLWYVRQQFGARFASIEPLPPLVMLHGGRVAANIPIYLGKTLRPSE